MARGSQQLEGTITSWNDDRGFGFIEPAVPGERVFFHISAFTNRYRRPVVGDPVHYDVGYAADGRRRATSVRQDGAAAPGALRRARGGSGGLVVILAFVALYIAVSIYWLTPIWVAGFYALASAVCFAAYAVDKSAAVTGGWRVSEATLFVLGLIGGWPGAIIAQQALRHKTIKASFRAAHWMSVVLNIALFVWACSPLFPTFLSRLTY